MEIFALALIMLVLLLGGSAIMALADKPLRPLDQVCEEAIRGHFKKVVPGLVEEVLREPEFKWFWFVKEMQQRMMEVDKTLTGERAWGLAINAYREHLKDEKIEFGDPRFDWSRDGARDLIQAYEIDHWESAA